MSGKKFGKQFEVQVAKQVIEKGKNITDSFCSLLLLLPFAPLLRGFLDYEEYIEFYD
ncbi:hypothetical protein [Brassicibacter mesophilus]|uniref:hypothetical protein n=1 Tax=Brassicibacter mesophilus TaxID=745119 RepID=UPI003D1E3336